MHRPAHLVALAGFLLGTVAALPVWAEPCQPAQVKPVFDKATDGQTLKGVSSRATVTFQGHVQKPAGCTAPTFSHVNLELSTGRCRAPPAKRCSRSPGPGGT